MFNIIYLIQLFFSVYTFMIFIRILSSWIPDASQYRFIQFISFYTDPYLNVFRQIIPPLGMFDLSPIVAFICLSFLESILIKFIVVFL